MTPATASEIITIRKLHLEPKAAIPEPQFHVTRPEARWNPAMRIGFRFVFSYFALYWLAMFVGFCLSKPLSWVAIHVLRLGHGVKFVMTGSGDAIYDYVLAFCVLVLAIGGTVVWSLLDRRRANYDRFQLWFRSLLRMGLGTILIGYGAIKVIQAQMPAPSPSTLLETYGQSTPMHLLWTFMGASRAYNAFAGGAEMLAGLLLFIPCLATLGALLSIGVMSNVFMLNMCYDVPVKLFSFHLLFMAAVLAAPDARSLVEMLVLGRRAELHKNASLFKRKWVKRSMLVLHIAFCGLVIGGSLYTAHAAAKFFRDYSKAPIYGVWSVDQYTVDGNIVPASPASKERWQQVLLDRPMRMLVEVNGEQQRFALKDDPTKGKTFNLRKIDDAKWKADFTYQQPQPGLLYMAGQMDGRHIEVRLKRMELPKAFPLTSRGFHWINEYPYNR
jgi:hypothetical protein